MIPTFVTLAEAGARYAAATPVTVVPPAAMPEAMTIPAARQAAGSGAYFELFKLCSCGHSSAWHSGAFGEAWRAGVQVHGGCEVADESSSRPCGCGSFKAALLD